MRWKQQEPFDFGWTVIVTCVGGFLMAILLYVLFYLFTYKLPHA